MRALVLVAVVACRHAPAVEAPHDTDDDAIPDDVDRCPDLATGCFLDEDDGCPDTANTVRVQLPLGADDRARLAAIARSLVGARDDALVVVIAPARPNEAPGLALERATAVALRLEEDGTPLARLVARAGPIDLAPGYPVTLDCITPATAPSASR